MPAPKGRSKSAKKPTPLELAKEDAVNKQIIIDEMTTQLAEINQSIEVQKKEEGRLSHKLHIILPEILAHRDREYFPLEPLNDVIDVDSGYVKNMLQQMITDLHGRQTCKTALEDRLAELEQRVTEQYATYQAERRKNLACIKGVEEALHAQSTFEVKFLVRQLRQNLMLEEPVRGVGSEEHPRTFTLTRIPSNEYINGYRPASAVPHFRGQTAQASVDQIPVHVSPIPSNRVQQLLSMELTPAIHSAPRPVRKMPGETRVKYMLPALREAINEELSIEKPGRGDWRHFALLVGISTETIQFWRRLNLPKPMEQVLAYWRERPSSTVVTLHRVLLADQMNAVQLAAIVSQFYQVD